MNERVKYPKTPHLPWSEAVTDDPFLDSVQNFSGRRVVVTEKMDGECTTAYPDYIHARSPAGHPHPSRDWVRGLWGSIRHEIPKGWRVCGENLYAQHSIRYDTLESYFMVFSIWDRHDCFSWDETKEWSGLLGLSHVPVLWEGLWDEARVRACMTGRSTQGGEQEGYVVRLADGFRLEDFAKSVAKFVRKNHVQTGDHWMDKPVVPNGLRKAPHGKSKS